MRRHGAAEDLPTLGGFLPNNLANAGLHLALLLNDGKVQLNLVWIPCLPLSQPRSFLKTLRETCPQQDGEVVSRNTCKVGTLILATVACLGKATAGNWRIRQGYFEGHTSWP